MGILDPKPQTVAGLDAAVTAKITTPGSAVATALSATIGTQVSAGVAPKLDITAAAASYAKLGTQKSRRPIDPRSVLMPGAPFERAVASSDLPTIVFSATNPVASAKVVPFFSGGKVEGSPYFSAVAGADWSQPVLNEGTTRAWANQTGAGVRGQHSPASIMFGFDGASITLKIHSWAGNWYRVKVDDQYVTDVNGVLAPSDQTIQYMTLTWSAAKRRRVRIDMRNVDVYDFRLGTTATTGDTMWALNPRGPKVFVMADSYAAGNNSAPLGYTGISSWVWTMSDALGWENTINGGKYGTGWPTKSAVDKTDSFQERVAALISWAPDVVIWAGGHNDKNVAAGTLTASVDATLAAARAGLPDALFIVTGPFAGQEPVDGSVFTDWKPTQDAIFAGTTGYRTVNIDTVGRGLFTGTGRAGTPGTGNGEKYLSADIVHPSQAGADYLGYRMAQMIFEAMTKA